MSARPRDIIKTRAQRLGEVFTWVHERTGHANNSIVAFGGTLSASGTPSQLAVSDTCAVLAGAIVDKTAASAIAVGSTSDTGAGQFRRTLIEMDAAGTITFKPGAIAGDATSAQTAANGLESTDKVLLGYLDTGASFTGGTTTLAGKLTKAVYFGA